MSNAIGPLPYLRKPKSSLKCKVILFSKKLLISVTHDPLSFKFQNGLQVSSDAE